MVEATNADLLAGLLTAQEAAKALHGCRRTLDAMHTRRKGPPRTKIASRVYYSREALERWLHEQQESPPASPRRRRQ